MRLKKSEKEGQKGKEGEKGKDGNQGEKGNDGEKDKNGEKGEEGKDGKEGEKGESGEKGKSGENGNEGEGGKSRKNGKQGKGQGSKGEGKEGENGNDKGGKNGKSGKNGTDGKGNGDKNGKNGKGDGNGKGESNDGFLDEENNAQIFKIYQQQQRLRQELDKRLEKDGLKNTRDASRLLRQMQQAELGILNQGVTKQTLSKMREIKHQLLKLDKAILQQGEDKKRKSDTNKKTFENTSTNVIDTAKSYFNTTEILNKQNLPLQPVYKQKVQQYFNNKND